MTVDFLWQEALFPSKDITRNGWKSLSELKGRTLGVDLSYWLHKGYTPLETRNAILHIVTECRQQKHTMPSINKPTLKVAMEKAAVAVLVARAPRSLSVLTAASTLL